MSFIEYVQVQIPQGDLIGISSTSIYEETYFSFLGIPYGQPPTGPLRFKAPLPAGAWEGVRDCTVAPQRPVQKDFITHKIFGMEDCLYLNVFAKTIQTKLTSRKKLPVMVFIYGGGFENGYADTKRCNPDYFMSESIVLVTFNYRLAVLGFLSLSSPELDVPGNAGLKDMVLALKWVKQNIIHFNGDPDNITVFGNSAGACATHILMSTTQTKNLFHKAILQSGCMLNPWAHMPQCDMPFRLAKALDYNGENNESDILNYLQRMPAERLVSVNLMTNDDRDYGILYAFGPTMEPYVTEHCIIAEPYTQALETAWGNEIPLIIGATTFEGLVCYPFFRNQPNKLELYQKNPSSLLPTHIQNSSISEEDKSKMVNLLIQTHLAGKSICSRYLLDFLDIFSYRYFWLGIIDTIEMRMRVPRSASTYLYRFNFDSEIFAFRRFIYTNNEVKAGVAHADEMNYLFHFDSAWKLETSTIEYETIQRMISLWTSFAATSRPTCPEMISENKSEDFAWHCIDKFSLYMCLDISKTLQFIELPEKPKVEVWRTLSHVA